MPVLKCLLLHYFWTRQDGWRWLGRMCSILRRMTGSECGHFITGQSSHLTSRLLSSTRCEHLHNLKLLKHEFCACMHAHVVVLQHIQISHEKWIGSASVLHGEHVAPPAVWLAERRYVCWSCGLVLFFSNVAGLKKPSLAAHSNNVTFPNAMEPMHGHLALTKHHSEMA